MRVAAKRREINVIEMPNTRTSSVGYAATFPKGKAKISFAPIRTVENACTYKRLMTVIGNYR